MTGPRRYSSRAFPAYRYVPGRTPHPSRDPDGHSYGRTEPAPTPSAQGWQETEPYRFAIDLFNAGYYWESHEVLEAVWNAAGHDSSAGLFAQGVIQAAAALLKHSMGERGSALRLANTATAKLRSGAGLVLAVRAHVLADELEAYLEGTRELPPTIALVGEAESADED